MLPDEELRERLESGGVMDLLVAVKLLRTTAPSLLRAVKLLRTRPATAEELAHILTDDCRRILRDLTPVTYRADSAWRHKIGVLSGDERIDNPAIDGLWDYYAR